MMNENNGIKMATPSQLAYLEKLDYQGSKEITYEVADRIIKNLSQAKQQQQAQQQTQQQYQSNNNYSNNNYSNNYQQAPKQNTYQPSNNNSFKNDVAVTNELGIVDLLGSSLKELAEDGTLFVPENYSIGNALKSAMSKILTSDQCDKLLNCTPESKSQALTEYIVQGLDASKNQAYFIPYGNKMTMMRSYFGDVAVAKRTGLVKDVFANVIYDGDEVEIGFDEYGRKTLISHKTDISNQDNDIKGAYAVIVGVNGYKAYEFMTRKELEASWKMSKMPNGKLHSDYKQEAAKRTVIRRAVKMIFNSSLNTTEEQTALIGSYNRTTPNEYDNDIVNAETENINTQEVKESQKTKTASKKISVDAEEDWINS